MAGDEREEKVESQKRENAVRQYWEQQDRLREAALSLSGEVPGQMFGREWNLGGVDVAYRNSPELGFPYLYEEEAKEFWSDMGIKAIDEVVNIIDDELKVTKEISGTKFLTKTIGERIGIAADAYKFYNADDKVKAVAEIAGENIGSKAGMAAGAAIGTAIFPVVGTAIGGAIGYFGGGYLGDKMGGGVVDYFRYLRDNNIILPTESLNTVSDAMIDEILHGKPVNMEELLHPYIPPPEEAMGDEEAFRSLSLTKEELLNEEFFRSTLPPQSDQGSQYNEQEVNNQNITVNIAVEGQGDENGIVNKLVARLGEVFENMNTSGFGVA